jgi:YidC/Oxa1 family membrane protein insertase
MDRNTVIGFVLIAGIFVIFSILNRPSEQEMEEMQRKRDSIELARQEQIEEERQAQEQRKLQEKKEEEALTPEKVEKDSQLQRDLEAKYGAFESVAVGKKEFITIESDVLKLKISTEGGKVYSAELKDYQTHDSLPLILFEGDSTEFGFNFFAQRRLISTNELFFTPQTSSTNIVVSDSPETLTMRLAVDSENYIDYIYTVEPGDYMVDFDIEFHGFTDIMERNINSLDLYWDTYLPQHEKGKSNENNYTTIAFKHYNDEVEEFNGRTNKDVIEEEIPTKLKWIAFKDQFFSSVLIADNSFNNGELKWELQPEESRHLKKMRAEIAVPYEPTPGYEIPMRFYFGPNHFNTLKKYDELELQELLNIGNHIIKVINKFVIIPIFNFLEQYINNYGLIILILTIIIKMALLPLTYKSYLSTAKMRVLKPQIDEINAKIPKDKAMERQQATMNLYKKAGVSPLGGCLPMLLQMPILIAMFRFFPTSIELRQESFLWAQDLSTYDAILEWSTHIPLISKFYGNHVSLFTILMTVTTVFSMRINSTATSGTQQMPGMKGMMYVMPFMFMFILNNFSAGLTYYYFLANLITLGQNFIFKNSVDDKALLKKLEARKAKPVKKSSFQKRLEEMSKQQNAQKSRKK